jgi:hypothetical protein
MSKHDFEIEAIADNTAPTKRNKKQRFEEYHHTGAKPLARDVHAMQFLWKWRLATTKVLQAQFYQGASAQTCHARLRRLLRCGWISTHTFLIQLSKKDGPKRVTLWMLSDRGFHYIKDLFESDLRTQSFRPQSAEHDLWVAAVALMDEDCGPNRKIEVVSENMLQNLSAEVLPEWVPKDLNRRADALIRFSDDYYKKTIALEVEINIKSKEAYDTIGQHYSLADEIDFVLWVVRDIKRAFEIARRLESDFNTRLSKHQFVLLEDILKFANDAEILVGSLMGQKLGVMKWSPQGQDRSITVAPSFKNEVWLDTRLIPIDLTACKEVEKIEIPNSIPPLSRIDVENVADPEVKNDSLTA